MVGSSRKITRNAVVAAALAVVLGACQTTGGTAAPGGPSHYRGLDRAVATAPQRIAYVPLSQQNVQLEHLQFSVRTGLSVDRSPYEPLLEEMNAMLGSVEGLKRIEPEALPFGQDLRGSTWTGPWVTYGMRCGNNAQSPVEGARRAANSETTVWSFGSNRRAPTDPRVFQTKRANEAWRERVRSAAEAADVDYILLFTVGPSYYVTRGSAVGARQLELGTGHSVSLPFHVRRNQCFGVLHMMAILVDRDGEVVRTGAEGMLAGSVLGGAVGSAADLIPEISTEQIRERATREVREDLDGQPQVWRVAMEHLLHRLTGLGLRTTADTIAGS